jgi:hypothetical protein
VKKEEKEEELEIKYRIDEMVIAYRKEVMDEGQSVKR